jgi:hypothetical protein
MNIAYRRSQHNDIARRLKVFQNNSARHESIISNFDLSGKENVHAAADGARRSCRGDERGSGEEDDWDKYAGKNPHKTLRFGARTIIPTERCS